MPQPLGSVFSRRWFCILHSRHAKEINWRLHLSTCI